MLNRTINQTITFRVLGIVVTTVAASLLTFFLKQWVFVAVGFVLLVWQTISVIYLMNKTNRQIAFFFDAIRNEDSTLHFPLNTGNKAIDELNISMNRLNQIIGTAKMQNRAQEQYFETIIEQAATGLLTFNEKGHVLLTNSAARKLLGLEPFTHISQLDKVEKGLAREFMGLKPDGHKLINLTNERGVMQLSVRATAMLVKNKYVTLVSIQDIRNELDEKETESWIRLIRVLTHEIMNSIAPITSLSETISGYYESQNELKKAEDIDEQIISNTVRGLKVIRERGAGLVKFVESYRKLTHLHDPVCKNVNLHVLLEKVKVLLFSEFNFRSTGFSITLQNTDIKVFVDENLFSQVLINLVRNSLEALQNQENGRIVIRALPLPNEHVLIEVTDNGPGIEAGLLDKIFVPFFTTRENGSGIGLSLSRQIIRLHGGTLNVKSQPGNTCFEIVL